jgi:catechol 2,3-dioxygenase-like lactoylglutathione lyase family enzyme
MSGSPSFTRIESVVLRVRSRQAAVAWYRASLGLQILFEDPGEGMAVFNVGQGCSLTIWEVPRAAEGMLAGASGTFPILEAVDAHAYRLHLQSRGVTTSELRETAVLRCFTFWDPDNNRLDVCEVLEALPR